VDNSGGSHGSNDEYISVSQASEEFGLNKSMIRTAIKRGDVHTQNHPWGMRIMRGDVAKLKEQHDRLDKQRRGL
jgi:hypothetical protein